MRILSLDGGGMKGLYACSYLQVFENHFGKPLHEVFDLVCGTSTGGIIALGIGAGLSMDSISEFYRFHGPKIFPNGQKLRKLYRWIRWGYAYDPEPLRHALNSVFGDLKMRDSKVHLCIPSTYKMTGEARVFKATNVPHLTRDQDISMVEVAMAASAAPFFFPVAIVMEQGSPIAYIDAGVYANNPANIGFTEAQKFHVGKGRSFAGIHMLSISLPGQPVSTNQRDYGSFSPKSTAGQMISISLDSQKDSVHRIVKYALEGDPGSSYYRAEPPRISPRQARCFKLDASTGQALDDLAALGLKAAHNDKNLETVKLIFS